MEDSDIKQKALNLAYFYLKFRNRTEKEMKVYLSSKKDKKQLTEESIENAIERLKELKFINDEAFVEQYVHSKSLIKPKSEYALKRELSLLGISKEIIDEYFQEHELDEETLAYNALQPRWNRYVSLSQKERDKKIISFLGRRGFSYDVIKKTIAKMTVSK